MNHVNEHINLKFIWKTTNQRWFPPFEGSRSSTKRHKALTHNPLKQVWRKMPPNLMNDNPPKNALKIPLKKKNTGNKRYSSRLRESFH
jgi:hypothetical protein